eukprot:UN33747
MLNLLRKLQEHDREGEEDEPKQEKFVGTANKLSDSPRVKTHAEARAERLKALEARMGPSTSSKTVKDSTSSIIGKQKPKTPKKKKTPRRLIEQQKDAPPPKKPCVSDPTFYATSFKILQRMNKRFTSKNKVI